MNFWPAEAKVVDAGAQQDLGEVFAGSHTNSSSRCSPGQAAVSDKVSAVDKFDVVVIGAGIGGLSCAAMLAYYGLKVLNQVL